MGQWLNNNIIVILGCIHKHAMVLYITVTC